jgi:hypothetical protein
VNPALACRRRFTGSRGTSLDFVEIAPVKRGALGSIADFGLRIEEFRSHDLRSAASNPQSAIRNPQSAIRNPVTDLAESGAGVTESGSTVARNV